MAWSQRVEFATKFLAKSFALSDADEITSDPLMMVVIEDIALFRTLLFTKTGGNPAVVQLL